MSRQQSAAMHALSDYSASSEANTRENIPHSLRENLQLTHIWLSHSLGEFLDSFGITIQQYQLLTVLREANNEPLSTKELARRMITKNSDTSRLVSRLTEKDLARKRRDPDDGRLIQVFITYEGLKLLGKIDDRQEQMNDIFSNLDASELQTLNKLLKKLRT